MGIVSFIKEVSYLAKELTSIAVRPSWKRNGVVQNPARLTDERLNWILAIGAPFVEDMIEPGYQDVLTVFPPEETANARLVSRLKKYQWESATHEDLMTCLDDLEKDSLDDEDSMLLWYQIAPSHRGEALAVSEQEESSHEEVWNYLYETKNDHSRTDVRLFELASTTLKVRIACFLSVISEEECKQILERLAGKIQRRLAGVESWIGFADKIRAGWMLDIRVEDDEGGMPKNLRELHQNRDSLWNLVPFDSGWSLPAARENRAYSNLPLPAYKSKSDEICDTILELAKNGDFEEAFELIETEASNTNDESFLDVSMSVFSVENFDVQEMDALPDLLKGQPLAHLARANWLKDWGWVARGTGTSDMVGEQGYQRFYERLKLSWKDLQKARDELPEEPTVLRRCLEVLPHLDEDDIGGDSDEETQLILGDLQARFPGYQPALRTYFHFQATKWGGDFDRALNFAQYLSEQAPEGSVVPLAPFQVVLQEWEYIEYCMDDEKALKTFLAKAEMNKLLDSWFEPLLAAVTPENEFTVLSTLSCWYFLRKDTVRLEKISDLMGQPALYEGSYWDDVYKREYVVAALNRIYYS